VKRAAASAAAYFVDAARDNRGSLVIQATKETIAAASLSRDRHVKGRAHGQLCYLLLWLLSIALTGCGGPQSTLTPAGRTAERIADLFWWMMAGAVFIWLAVVVLAAYAARAEPGENSERKAHTLILVGAIAPAVVLCGLLIYGLGMLQDAIAPAPANSLRISVVGEQWWWRVRYEPPGRQPFELANQILLPVGEPVEFRLHSKDVIHSFWIPSLAGKMDMIPGRVTRLAILPTKTGSFRGVCGEYCGRSHANMAFQAVVVPRAEFARWLEQESQSSATGASE
jgi:cytochrome c oxidase subunit 2